MKIYKTTADIEAAIVSGEISSTNQLRKALAVLECYPGGNSRMSMEVNLNFNDMRKAATARQHDLPRLKKIKRRG